MGAGYRPDKASDQVICVCEDGLGVPHPGLAIGLWQPARLIEVTRTPSCAPTLGGIKLPIGNRRLLGTFGQQGYDNSDEVFYNVHYYAFPLLVLLDLFFEDRCAADGYVDFDLLQLSELDPTWNSCEVAFFATPEVALFANPLALAACMVDAVRASAGEPQDELFWCAGSWGRLYPPCGRSGSYGARTRQTSLFAARTLAALHRRGQAWLTMGDEALCRATLHPILPKSQYQLSMFYPLPETERAHVIGATPFVWGEHRTAPGPGEHHVYLLWRWHDCCNTF